MNNEFAPRKAEKKRVKLKMAVQGPSGSGKTWGALALAKNMWPEAKVCVIDTENESASLYADRFAFDTIPLGPPFTTARYVECIEAVVKGGYGVLIIDSITPQWDGEGGILRRKEALERANPNANGYALWSRFTPEHEAFKQIILQSPLHVICTMRSKQEYALQPDEKGKLKPVKLGLAPIQRDQLDYEFTLVFDVNLSHNAAVSKDRTGLFDEQAVNLADPKTADAIRGWLESGVEVAQKPASASATHAQRPAAGNNWQPPTLAPNPAVKDDPLPHQSIQPTAPNSPGPFTKNMPSSASIDTQNEGCDPQQYPYAILAGTILTCTPLTITEKKRKVTKTEENPEGTQPYIFVYFKGNVKTISEFSCFDTGLFEPIRAGLNQECQFKVDVRDGKDGKTYFNIKDVVYVGKQYYEFGKPAQV